jgi:hypothetical protein
VIGVDAVVVAVRLVLDLRGDVRGHHLDVGNRVPVLAVDRPGEARELRLREQRDGPDERHQ